MMCAGPGTDVRGAHQRVLEADCKGMDAPADAGPLVIGADGKRLRHGDARRSSARNEKRLEALRECVRMITTSAGGCTTPFPFEAAIWLLEEQEELYGGALPVYNTTVSAPCPVQQPYTDTRLCLGYCSVDGCHRSTDRARRASLLQHCLYLQLSSFPGAQ